MVDPHSVLSALGVVQPASVTPVSGGWDTALWRVDVEDRRYALRVFRAEQAGRCQREAVVMRTAAAFGLPIPPVCAEAVGGDRPALLLGWCDGRTLMDEGRSQAWRLWQLAVAMGRAHARLHALPVPNTLLQSVPMWSPAGVGLEPRIEAMLTASGVTRLSLLHLDYHPLNVMVRGRRLTGVLDWANAAIGDRRADLARTVTMLRLAPVPPGMSAALQVVARGLLEAGWRRGYRWAQQPSAPDPFNGLEPFYVWAGAMMERDLRPKLGRPGVWLQESDLARIRRWTSRRVGQLG